MNDDAQRVTIPTGADEAQMLDFLKERWDAIPKTDALMQHAGNPNTAMKTTLNVRDNPLLIAAIEEIRDGYFEMLNRMLQLSMAHKNNNFASKLSPPELEQEKRILGKDFVRHNSLSLNRLMRPGYGLPQERCAEILGCHNPESDQMLLPDPLSIEDASLVMGKIIGRSLDCFDIIPGARQCIGVPNSFAQNPVNGIR